jgi:hypothetical protein
MRSTLAGSSCRKKSRSVVGSFVSSRRGRSRGKSRELVIMHVHTVLLRGQAMGGWIKPMTAGTVRRVYASGMGRSGSIIYTVGRIAMTTTLMMMMMMMMTTVVSI